ncbi:MAG: UrcA family protein [Woeseia sp.]
MIVILGIPVFTGAAYSGHPGKNTVRVSYADLDLSAQTGVATLYKRLQRAVDAACGSRSLTEVGSIERVAKHRQC